MKPAFTLPGDDTVLPRGTRVIVTSAVVDAEGARHRPGMLAVVREVNARAYTVETPGGLVVVVDRKDLQLERADLLLELGRRQWDERRLREHIIYAAVVGSRAWNLHDDDSDEDVRGCFVLPFEEHVSIYDAPDEIHDEERQLACWEIEKLVRQGLRADPNTLETLWSPLVKIVTPLGQKLVDARGIFSSRRVVQSFGRYAGSQLTKLERAAERARLMGFLLDEIDRGRIDDERAAKRALPPNEDLHALVRSLFDRGLIASASFAAVVDAVHAIGPARLAPDEVRPKNAYNLVRLLCSCLHFLEHGEPLIHVDGDVREELLAIKRGETPLEKTLERARALANDVEDRAQHSTPLPEEPDVDAADALVREARRTMARSVVAFGTSSPLPSARGAGGGGTTADSFTLRFFPKALPPDVETGGVRRFLERELSKIDGACVIVGLTGAHAYGFPSPDSDLDLKAIHAAPASTFLGLRAPPGPHEIIEIFEGREMDLSSHELGLAAQLLLKGNGNMLERLLGPLPVVVTPIGERLMAIAQRSLSKRLVHHYRGFLHAMKRESDLEGALAGRTAKRLLYAYRVAFTGAHALRERALVTDVHTLAPLYGFAPQVQELWARKRSGEHAILDENEAAAFLTDLPKLDALLDDALKISPLPSEPDVADDLDALLVEARLGLIR